MDIANYIFFGDSRLANQFYVVVHPLSTAALFAALALPPWIGAWYAGRRGLASMVTLQFLAICGLGAYAYGQINSDYEFAYDVPRIILRVAVFLFGAVALSAILAWVWLHRRDRRRGPAV